VSLIVTGNQENGMAVDVHVLEVTGFGVAEEVVVSGEASDFSNESVVFVPQTLSTFASQWQTVLAR
jgi:hypothetical protein